MKKLSVWMLLAATLVVAGCAKVPKAEVDAAKAAFQAAVAAEAEAFVPDVFARAKASVAEMDAEVASQAKKVVKSYDKAKSLAAVALKNSNDAKAAADARKTELRTELPRTLATLQSGVTTTADKLAVSLGVRGIVLDNAALRRDLDQVRTLLAQSKADFDGGKLADANGKANQARDLLARVNKTIDDARAAATVKKR
jgi:hypothetical protein